MLFSAATTIFNIAKGLGEDKGQTRKPSMMSVEFIVVQMYATLTATTIMENIEIAPAVDEK